MINEMKELNGEYLYPIKGTDIILSHSTKNTIEVILHLYSI